MDEKRYTKAVIDTKAANHDSDFVAVASTAVEDRSGEVVSVEGWELKNYRKNPVLLWGHDHTEMAVGQAKKVWIEGTGKRAKLMIEGFIHEATEKARALKYLVKEGIIKTMSVGFRPIEMDDNTYTKQELYEVSFVNVPANQEAFIAAYKSLQSAGFKKKTIAELGIPVDVLDRLDTLEKDINELKLTVAKGSQSPASRGRKGALLYNRQMHARVIARSTEKLLLAEKQPVSKTARVTLLKTIKRASEKIIVTHKEQLNGKNQGTT